MTRPLPRAQKVTERALNALESFLHIEAVSGIVLLLAAAAALVWANSPFAEGYQHLWHTPLGVSFGDFQISHSLHFWINDALMTVFFLVVGMEVRREMHDGSLASLKQAALPVVAALGGVIVPALIYFALNRGAPERQGWAIPTATDIAFAIGVLALLGKSIPDSVRVFLLALAVIDDIVAVLIIAVFYSGGLEYEGFLIAGVAVLMVLAMQRMGIGAAYAYLFPGAILWFGLLKTGAHPTLAGVALGLMTPVASRPSREGPVAVAVHAIQDFRERREQGADDTYALMQPVRRLGRAQRELLPPVVRVQMALHPWVAYAIMPLFALANAGVNLGGVDLSGEGARSVVAGVALALVLGKPAGIMGASWLAVRLGCGNLPAGMNWAWLALVGGLAGIGFTMSLFIAMLAFGDETLLASAKLGVLIASVCAGIIGLLLGVMLSRLQKR